MNFLISLTLTLCCTLAHAYIPKTKTILSRVVDNAGAGPYLVEQEVQFPVGTDSFTVKETWYIDNENNMVLEVHGTRELKDRLHFVISYQGNKKSWVTSKGAQSHALSFDFIEKPFYIRRSDSLGQHFIQAGILPPLALARKATPRNLNEVHYQQEAWVRMGRVGGSLAWVFGEPAKPDSTQLPPGLWIEQDQFYIRKIRWPQQVELTADNYSSFSRGLNLPKNRILRWSAGQVNIQLLSAKSFSSKERPNKNAAFNIGVLQNLPVRAAFEEFYTRFR